ncbi:MAG: hypothetical protein H6747_11040 [Deltaproteobacteria bacterium]|nr:hypothetical protein [Deltaproteobacteria bacterium]
MARRIEAATQPEAARQSEAGDARPIRLRRAVVRTLAYADLFDFPLRDEEIWRQLLLETATLSEVRALLEGAEDDAFLGPRIRRAGAYWSLADRPDHSAQRERRAATAERLIADHRGVLRLAARLPWVRMVAFSGGTSRRNSIHDDDLDLFIVTEEGRTWAVFLGLVVLARATGCRDVLCANYLVDKVHITVPDGGDLFTGQELLGLEPIAGERQLRRMATVNDWANRLLPNAGLRARNPLIGGVGDDDSRAAKAQRWLERALLPTGWAIERIAQRGLGWHLGRKKRASSARGGDMLLLPGVLKLHQSDNRASVVRRFRERLAALEVDGEDLDRLLEPRRRRAAGGVA